MNVAASNGHGQAVRRRLFGLALGDFVPPDSPIENPADLAGVPISVGYQSGSHYSTIQALEQYLPAPIQALLRGRNVVHPMEQLLDARSRPSRCSAARITSPSN